jgi:hypothetical protein
VSSEVQKNTGSVSPAGVTTTTLSITLPAAVTSGNAIAVAFSYQGSAGSASLTSITDDKGNTYALTQSLTATYQANAFIGISTVFNVTNAPQTISITIGNTVAATIRASAVVYEVTGAAFVDASTNGQSTATTNPPAINFSTVQPSEFAIVCSNTDNGSATFVQNNGWTQDILSLGTAQLCASKVLTASGANSLNMTGTPAVDIQWVVVSFGAVPGAALAGGAQALASGAASLLTGPAAFSPILLDDPAHAAGSDQIGMGTGVPGTGDTAAVAFPKLKQWAADANTNFAKLFPVRNLQAPATGFAIAAAKGVMQLVLNPAGTLATGTLTLPPNPGDNQPFTAMTSQTITALTVNTSDGTSIAAPPTTLSNTSAIKLRFQAAANTWFREQ